MSIGSINSITPFKKPFGTNVYGGVNIHAVQTGSIFGQGGNNQGSAKAIDKNSSIFNTNMNINSVSGLNPFSSVNKTTTGVSGVSPIHARENYRNGLAPSDNLQQVFAGNYKGKTNILNQIAIA